jgi:hypothetical protein
MTGLTDLGIAAIRDGVRDGSFSAVEVATAFNAAVDAADLLNAFIVKTPELALEAAQAVDAARASGGDLGAMAGVPIGMKDLFCTAGVQTTAASHMLEGFVPTYESTVSANLARAGAGMLGKLNLDQFAMGSSNETSYFGGWIGRSHRGAAVSGGDWHRHRRFDPPARRLRGGQWYQADLWPLFALGHRRVRIEPRSGRTDGARCARLRDHA